MKRTDNQNASYAQMGMAAILPGMIRVLEIVQQHVDELKAQLGQRQKRGPGRPPKDATIDATSHIRTSGWPADPEARRAEMARRMCAIQSLGTKAMWTLADDYERQGKLAAHALHYDADTHEERNRLRILMARLDSFEELARDIALAEMRAEAGDIAWLCDAFAVRTNFTLVACPEPSNLAVAEIVLPPELKKRIAELMQKLHGETNAEVGLDPSTGIPKRKPQ